MRVRDRHEHDDAVPQLAQSPGDGNGETEALRDEGATFLAAADDAITRALSRNSEQFLAQNRQMSGQ